MHETVNAEQLIIARFQFYCKEHVEIGEKFGRFAFVSHLKDPTEIALTCTDSHSARTSTRCTRRARDF